MSERAGGSPSVPEWRQWPTVQRAGGLVERVCPHGVGHPDPASVARLAESTGGAHHGVHGCDGCCATPAR
jgi:hypothetical protein